MKKSYNKKKVKYIEDHEDVMLDLETLSTMSNAVIVSIAAIKFKRDDKWSEKITMNDIKCHDHFYLRVDSTSCTDVGLHTDPDTVKWWHKQDDNVKYEALVNPNRTYIKDALEKFTKWIGKDGKKTRIWGNGSSFDCVVLREAYRACNMEIPWSYYNERDLRTVMELGDVKWYELPQTNKHNPLFDVYRQVLGLQRAERKIYG